MEGIVHEKPDFYSFPEEKIHRQMRQPQISILPGSWRQETAIAS